MWSGKGQTAHGSGLLPGRATVGPLLLMLICPWLGLLLTHANLHLDGSLGALASALAAAPLATLRASVALPSGETWRLLAGFAAFQLAAMRLVPGRRFVGPVSPHGVRPVYTANGFQCFLLTLAAFLVCSLQLRWFSPTVVYDRYAEIITALTAASFAFCGALYVKGLWAPSGPDAGSCGNAIVDFYWGTELYPRVLGWDVKQFTNCRWGMMCWAVFPLSFAAASMARSGGALSPAMAVNVALQLVYVAKFFWWETGYLATMDIQHDRAGWYICWGCLVWVPSVYVSHSLFLVTHAPAWCSPAAAAAIFALGWACVYINYDADRQRGLARATNGDCRIWGRPARVLPAKYKTEGGEVRSTILLADGWWAVSRHFHYVPEIAAALCWSLPGGFTHFMPYFYVTFLTILLVDRGESAA